MASRGRAMASVPYILSSIKLHKRRLNLNLYPLVRRKVSREAASVARLVLEDGDLVVRLSWWERLLARRREVRVPVADVKDVRIEPDWWRSLRGTPHGGLCRPGHCLGVRRHARGRDFVAVRADEPVVVVDLWSSAPFARLAVSAQEPVDEVVRSVDEVVRTVRHRRVRERPRPGPRRPRPPAAPSRGPGPWPGVRRRVPSVLPSVRRG